MALYYLDAQDANYPYQVVRKRLSDGGYVGQMPISASLVSYSEGSVSQVSQVMVLPMGGLGSTSIQFNQYDWAACLPELTDSSTDAKIMAYLSTLFTGQLGTLVPFALTAGDWLSIEHGIVSFSGGTVNNDKSLNTSVTYNGLIKTTERNLLSKVSDSFLFTIQDESTGNTTASSGYYFGAEGLQFYINEWSGGVNTAWNNILITPNSMSMSAYPNTRNDFPVDFPINLLATDENGKIQSYRRGVTATISILGITLRFVNGILVEYTP